MMQSEMVRNATSSRTRVLLTGFGPFPGVPVNATMRLVPMLAEAIPNVFPDLACEHLLLATEWETAPIRVAEAHRTSGTPDLVLHFGVSSRARGFEIETRARNACQMSADAAGVLPLDPELAPDSGRAFLPSTLPVAHVVARLRARRIPAFVSRDAGAYLCNAVLWRSLETQRSNGIARLGFVHIPASLAKPGRTSRGRSGACPLTWDQALAGGLEIIAASLGRPSPRL